MDRQKECGIRIIAATEREVSAEEQRVVNNCDSYCSGDDYCSDYHDTD